MTIVIGDCTTLNCVAPDQPCNKQATIAIQRSDIGGKRVQLKALGSGAAQGRAIELSGDFGIAEIYGACGCSTDETKDEVSVTLWRWRRDGRRALGGPPFPRAGSTGTGVRRRCASRDAQPSCRW
jgi:hypothetical protein